MTWTFENHGGQTWPSVKLILSGIDHANSHAEREQAKAQVTTTDIKPWEGREHEREEIARKRGEIDWLAYHSSDTKLRELCQHLSAKYLDHDHRIWSSNGKPEESIRSRIQRGEIVPPDRDGIMAHISDLEI